MTVKRGDRISEYILEEPLGRGGFGEVWRAHHHLWADRAVAVKIPTSPDALRDLTNEGIIQSGLDHPGIVRTLGMDAEAEQPYFITEYVPGMSLREFLREQGELPIREVRRLFLEILGILEYAHDEGIVHHDIKPENILVTPDGHVKLADFGLGRSLSSNDVALSASLRSEDGRTAGTLAYLAPEVRDGEPGIDSRADLYSMGIVLFELLTGRRPVGLEVPGSLRPGLPPWCDQVFQGLYARRESRIQTVADVRSKIERPGPALQDRDTKILVRVTPLKRPVNPELLRLSEACRTAGLSEMEMRRWANNGAIRLVESRGGVFVNAQDLAHFRESHPVVVSSRATVRPGSRSPRFTKRRQATSAALGTSRVTPPSLPQVAAGFWERTFAMAIDLWLFALAVPALALPLFGIPGILIGFVGYFGVVPGLYGHTFGKLALGLRVVRTDGRRLTAADGVVRSINYLLSALPAGLGFLWVAIDPNKRSFHDLLCSTAVVRRRR